MQKRVILVTGTPCVGKTSVARNLSSRIGALYVNLTDLALSENLVEGIDRERDSTIVSEKKMKDRIRKIIKDSNEKDVVIDGHYAASVVPARSASLVLVLRRNPVELRRLMEQRGYSGPKLWENLGSEILDICLVDSLNAFEKRKVCELDVSEKETSDIVDDVLEILKRSKKCKVGIVDWLGDLESQGLLGDYLKI